MGLVHSFDEESQCEVCLSSVCQCAKCFCVQPVGDHECQVRGLSELPNRVVGREKKMQRMLLQEEFSN